MGGVDLLLWGNTAGSVRELLFEGNEQSGVQALDQSKPLLEDNLFRDNGTSGLVHYGDSGGTARGNEMTGNGLHGIEVQEQAQPPWRATSPTTTWNVALATLTGQAA